MRWEYEMLQEVSIDILNEYGSAGWELVNIVVFRDGSFEAWLKRPKHGDQSPEVKP